MPGTASTPAPSAEPASSALSSNRSSLKHHRPPTAVTAEESPTAGVAVGAVDLTGDHHEVHRCISAHRGGRAASVDTCPRRIMATVEVTALPAKRAVPLADGRPVLVESLR